MNKKFAVMILTIVVFGAAYSVLGNIAFTSNASALFLTDKCRYVKPVQEEEIPFLNTQNSYNEGTCVETKDSKLCTDSYMYIGGQNIKCACMMGVPGLPKTSHGCGCGAKGRENGKDVTKLCAKDK